MPSRSSWSYLPRKGEGTCSDERYTPQWVLDLALAVMGGIDLDPCADPLKRVPATQHYTKEDDGLERAWAGKVFLNPPYSGSSHWFKHLCIYAESGAVTEAMVLVPVTSLGSKGARLLMKRTASCLTLFDRSFNFLGMDYEELPTTSPIPLCLVYIGTNATRFLEHTSDRGYGMLVHKPHPRHFQKQCAYCGKPFVAKRSTARYCGATCRKESHRRQFSRNSD